MMVGDTLSGRARPSRGSIEQFSPTWLYYIGSKGWQGSPCQPACCSRVSARVLEGYLWGSLR